jgi:large subunit ribosomal protein L23
MDILLKPIVTEKMTAQADKLNRFGFLVDKRVNKIQIKQSVEEMYGVNVVAVNTIVYAGKSKSRFTRTGTISGRTNGIKKALVTLAKGETIDFYSNI